MAIDPTKLKRRLAALKGLRSPHESVVRDCCEHSMPHLGSGFNGQVLGASDVQQQKAKLLDGTAGEALVTSADGFMGGMTPANAIWFGLDIGGEESHEEKAWLSDAAEAIWKNIHASNFDAEAYDAVLFILAAGWFALYCDEDDGGGYYFENWPIAQCYIAASRQGGKVDTVYREFPMAAGAMVAEYGRDQVSDNVRQMVDNGRQDETVDVLWAIEPRAGYSGGQMANQLPFQSCHLELATNTVLRESGYHEFPVVVPRWRRLPGSAYALGPMSDALPDVKSANEVARWEFAAAETVIAPPLKVVDDGVINARNIKLGPRKVIVCNDVNNIAPLITGAKVEFGQMMVEKLQVKIRRAMMADLFDKVLNDPTMTATQVHAILGMIRQRMGPRFGRMQSEWLQTLIERCYGVALRAGVLGQPPQSLLTRNYSIRYLSPLARAQKLDEVSSIESHEMALGQAAQVSPGVLDTYDWEGGARKKGELRGVPMDLLRDEKAVQAIRDQRAQAQQAAQQQQIQLSAQHAGAQAAATNFAGA